MAPHDTKFLEDELAMNELLHIEIAPAEPDAWTDGWVEGWEVMAVGCFEDEEPAVDGLPEDLAAAVRRAASHAGFDGSDKRLAIEASTAGGPLVVVYGLGERDRFEVRILDAWLDRVLSAARRDRHAGIVVALPPMDEARGPAAAERVCRRLALGGYRFDRFKSNDDDGDAPRLDRVLVVAPSGEASTYEAAVEPARSVAAGVVLARDLANTPGNVATPQWMEEQARELAERHGFSLRVIAGEELEELGMGGLLAVGGGSAVPPRLVRLERPGDGPTVALVGKGVTFDTGGISIKPAARMQDMKYDKCGSCAVLGALEALARLDLPVSLRAYLPFAENMPDGASYRPGDIVRCYNGKTVEIHNTDAEGRMILADALALAVEEGADHLVELSTLTGACVVALGLHGGGLFTPDDDLAAELLGAAEDSGERLWRLPLWSEFGEEMKGHHADLKNSGGRWGGASTAAAFLAQFADGVERWAHLDIAGAAQKPGDDGEATGYGVATLIRWLRSLS